MSTPVYLPPSSPSPNTLNEPRRETQQLRHGDTGGILPDTRKHCCIQIMMFMLRLFFLASWFIDRVTRCMLKHGCTPTATKRSSSYSSHAATPQVAPLPGYPRPSPGREVLLEVVEDAAVGKQMLDLTPRTVADTSLGRRWRPRRRTPNLQHRREAAPG